ncbi:MAG: hypothetical protein U0936_12070 [Planctomycetaceae bacterium]
MTEPQYDIHHGPEGLMISGSWRASLLKKGLRRKRLAANSSVTQAWG